MENIPTSIDRLTVRLKEAVREMDETEQELMVQYEKQNAWFTAEYSKFGSTYTVSNQSLYQYDPNPNGFVRRTIPFEVSRPAAPSTPPISIQPPTIPRCILIPNECPSLCLPSLSMRQLGYVPQTAELTFKYEASRTDLGSTTAEESEWNENESVEPVCGKPPHNSEHDTQMITPGKRKRFSTDLFLSSASKSIKEEQVFLLSDMLTAEHGSKIRADNALFKKLRSTYGLGWKRQPGKGEYRDWPNEVIVNPAGVPYAIKNHPQVGKDFFLNPQSAWAYCEKNCIITGAIDVAVDCKLEEQ